MEKRFTHRYQSSGSPQAAHHPRRQTEIASNSTHNNLKPIKWAHNTRKAARHYHNLEKSQPKRQTKKKSKSDQQKKRAKVKKILPEAETQFSHNQELKGAGLQKQYKKSKNQKVNWILPEDLCGIPCSHFCEFVANSDFDDLNNLKINFLHFTCKKRLIRDDDFDRVYQNLVNKFPQRLLEIQEILTEILTVLQS